MKEGEISVDGGERAVVTSEVAGRHLAVGGDDLELKKKVLKHIFVISEKSCVVMSQ